MKIVYRLIGMVMLGISHTLSATSLYQHSNDWHGIVGFGSLVRTEPYKDIKSSVLPLPYLIMRRGNFFVTGLKAGYRLLEGNQSNFDVIFKPRLEGFEAPESAFFDGLDDRDFSLDGGIATMWRQGLVEFNLSAVTDLLHKNDGREVKASVGKTYNLINQMTLFTPSIGLKWKSDKLVNYYYGVASPQVTLDRPAYTGEATMNYTAAVNATYAATKRSTLFADVEYEHFGPNISDSPLVDDEHKISIFLGYGWQF
jgi:outer membrane protein